MKTITIGLIDDHKIVRQGLKELLEKMGDYKVTHEFDNGHEFLLSLPAKTPPHLYIMDYSMPGMNGIEILKELENLQEEYKVLLLSQYFDEQTIDTAYHSGARGFLHKNCTATDLKFAIDNIVNMGYNNVVDILKRLRKYEVTPEEDDKNSIELTGREKHFLTLVCDPRELTYEQMADIMSVSVKSVEAYRSALFEKYNIKSKVGLVLFSYKHRLTEPFL